MLFEGCCLVGSQSCLIPFVHHFQFNGNIGSVLASGERSDLPYYLSAADGSACEIAGVSARWRYASCRAAFFLERSFFQCGRWRQASCRTCLQPGAGASRTRVCLLGRLLQCGFPVRPISAVATSILPHLGKQFFFSSGIRCFLECFCRVFSKEHWAAKNF